MIQANYQNENVTFESLPMLMVGLLNEVKSLREEISTKNQKSAITSETPEYLHSIKEIGKFLDLSDTTVQKLKNEGRIPFTQISERKFSVCTADLMTFLNKKRR